MSDILPIQSDEGKGKYILVDDLKKFLETFKMKDPAYREECFDQSWNYCLESIKSELERT